MLRRIEGWNDGVVFIRLDQLVPAVVARQHELVVHVVIQADRRALRLHFIDGVGGVAVNVDAPWRLFVADEERIQTDVVADEILVHTEVISTVNVYLFAQRGAVSHFERAYTLRTDGIDIEVNQRIAVESILAVGCVRAVSEINEAS